MQFCKDQVSAKDTQIVAIGYSLKGYCFGLSLSECVIKLVVCVVAPFQLLVGSICDIRNDRDTSWGVHFTFKVRVISS
jgi:hypothetical protein